MNRALALKNARAILKKRKQRKNTGIVGVFKPGEPIPGDFPGLAIVLSPDIIMPTI